MLTMSKIEFSRECRVSPARVTQWIAEGKISGNALVGEGRAARIVVDLAKEQIGLRRDVGQAIGNGLKTQLSLEAPPSGVAPSVPDRKDDVAHQIQVERLESERRRNRRESIEEQQRLGALVPVDDMRSQMGRLARQVDEANGAMLADFASAIAAKFQVSQRDVLHELRKVRAEKKAAEAARARLRAESLPATVEMVMSEEQRA